MTSDLKRAFPWVESRYLPVLIIGFGCLIRLVQYGYNRSLWADEAKLALNLVNRSYSELLQTLDYDQGAAAAFLLVEKGAIQVFGNNEYAMRLFPLVASLVSLALFYTLAKQLFARTGVLIAMTLFACNQYLVYYASELKQYSTDVTFAIAVFLMLLWIRTDKLTPLQIGFAGAFGAIAIWFSHPVLFVLAGVEACYVIPRLRPWLVERRWGELGTRSLIYLPWLISFALFYKISILDVQSNRELTFIWTETFPSSPWDIGWVFTTLSHFFQEPLGFPVVGSEIALAVSVLGCISLIRDRKPYFFLLVAPIGLTLLAAYLHQYPFFERLVLFLVPFFTLILTEGLLYLQRLTARPGRRWIASVVITILLTISIIQGALFLVRPYRLDDIKPLLSYVQQNWQTGDLLYVFQKGKFQFEYYRERYGFEDGEYVIGVDLDPDMGEAITRQEEERGYRRDINQFKGDARVWFLFSDSRMRDETEFILEHLETLGQQVDRFDSDVPSAFVYLYDLS